MVLPIYSEKNARFDSRLWKLIKYIVIPLGVIIGINELNNYYNDRKVEQLAAAAEAAVSVGDYAAAIANYSDALAFYQGHYGESNPRVVAAKYNLARVYVKNNDRQTSVDILAEAILRIKDINPRNREIIIRTAQQLIQLTSESSDIHVEQQALDKANEIIRNNSSTGSLK